MNKAMKKAAAVGPYVQLAGYIVVANLIVQIFWYSLVPDAFSEKHHILSFVIVTGSTWLIAYPLYYCPFFRKFIYWLGFLGCFLAGAAFAAKVDSLLSPIPYCPIHRCPTYDEFTQDRNGHTHQRGYEH